MPSLLFLASAVVVASIIDPPSGNWPQFGYNAQHTFASPFVCTVTAVSTVKWDANAPCLALHGSADLTTALYTGNVAAPVLDSANNVLVTTGCFNLTADISSFNSSTGALIFDFATPVVGQPNLQPPTLSTDAVISVSPDQSSVIAVSYTGGLKWTSSPLIPGPTGLKYLSSPALGGDGILYFMTFTGVLLAMSAETGTAIWNVSTGANPLVASVIPPSLSPTQPTVIYVAPNIGPYCNRGCTPFPSTNRTVQAFDYTGTRVWGTQLNMTVTSVITVSASGSLLFVAGRGIDADVNSVYLFALNAGHGTIAWQSSIGAEYLALSGTDSLIVLSDKLYCLDASTGLIMWSNSLLLDFLNTIQSISPLTTDGNGATFFTVAQYAPGFIFNPLPTLLFGVNSTGVLVLNFTLPYAAMSTTQPIVQSDGALALVATNGQTFVVSDGPSTAPPKVVGDVYTRAGISDVLGSYGDRGPSTLALLHHPSRVAATTAVTYGGSSSLILIADSENNCIRAVLQPSNVIVAFAGVCSEGPGGYFDGFQIDARFSYPADVAVGTDGTVYIADMVNNCIRAVADGEVTTFAGMCQSTGLSADGVAATSALFNQPQGVAVSANGNVFIADSGNNLVVVVSHACACIHHVAGTGIAGYSGDGGKGTSAMFSAPLAVAVDDAIGLLFVSDYGNNRVRNIVLSTGIVHTFAGSGAAGYSGDNGPASSAAVSAPSGLFYDECSGSLLIVDHGNGRIRVVDNTGVITTLAGKGPYAVGTSSPDGTPSTATTFNYLTGVAIDRSTGNTLIAELGDNTVRIIAGVPGIESCNATSTVASIVITQFPPVGGLTPIAGRVTGLSPTAALTTRIALYVRDAFATNWWIKAFPGVTFPLDAAGNFDIAGWASTPATDALLTDFALYALRSGTAVISTLGGPLPAYAPHDVLASVIVAPGFVPTSSPTSKPSPLPSTTLAPSASPLPAPSLIMTAFPSNGGLGPIGGRLVGGLPHGALPTQFIVVLYVQDAGGVHWWIKPYPSTYTAIGADGSFLIATWASSPTTDPDNVAFALVVIPSGTTVINLLGGDPLPSYPTALLSVTLPRSFVPSPLPSVTPPTPSAQPSGGPSTAALHITTFPAAGTLTAISGTVTGLHAQPSKVVLYIRDPFGFWWSKPTPGSSSPVDGSSGAFSFPAWASTPSTDVKTIQFALIVIPTATPIISALGTTALPGYDSATIASVLLPAGYIPPSTPGGGTIAAIFLSTFPAAHALTPIAGTVVGLPTGTAFEILLFLEQPGGAWWVKPLPGSSFVLSPTGAFSITGWASNPVTDPGWLALNLFVLPTSAMGGIPIVMGGPLPPVLLASAVAAVSIPTGFVVTAAAAAAGTDMGGTSTTPASTTANGAVIGGAVIAGCAVLAAVAAIAWFGGKRSAALSNTTGTASSPAATSATEENDADGIAGESSSGQINGTSGGGIAPLRTPHGNVPATEPTEATANAAST